MLILQQSGCDSSIHISSSIILTRHPQDHSLLLKLEFLPHIQVPALCRRLLLLLPLLPIITLLRLFLYRCFVLSLISLSLSCDCSKQAHQLPLSKSRYPLSRCCASHRTGPVRLLPSSTSLWFSTLKRVYFSTFLPSASRWVEERCVVAYFPFVACGVEPSSHPRQRHASY